MKKKISISAFVTVLLNAIPFLIFSQSTMHTMSDVNNALEDVEFRMLLETEVDKLEAAGLSMKQVFIPLNNYIDLNEIGNGRTVKFDAPKISKFISAKINKGTNKEDISSKLLEAYKQNEFLPTEQKSDSQEKEKTKVTVGGYFVKESEYHQEPDGKYHPLLEINQTRIYFGADINPAEKKNHVSFSGEWNPIPEEVIHQIDEITFVKDSKVYLLTNTSNETSDHSHSLPEQIPFERLYLRIDNLAASNINLTAGQFRCPFGIWSGFTSHRNFTSAKNNQLVNGFALKKVEL